MFRFLRAGLVAGTRQLVAVIVITSIALLVVSEKVSFEVPSEFPSEPKSFPAGFIVLAWAYLLTALGFACTQDRTLILTAERVRQATRLRSGGRGPKVLASQLIIAAILFATLALRPPPQFLIDMCQHAGYLAAAAAVWAGTLTTGVAFFGASAH